MELDWELIHKNFLELNIDDIDELDLNTLYCYSLINAIQFKSFNMLDNNEKIDGMICKYDNTTYNITNEQDYINKANFAKICYNNFNAIKNIIKIKLNELTDEEKENAKQLFREIAKKYGDTFCTH